MRFILRKGIKTINNNKNTSNFFPSFLFFIKSSWKARQKYVVNISNWRSQYLFRAPHFKRFVAQTEEIQRRETNKINSLLNHDYKGRQEELWLFGLKKIIQKEYATTVFKCANITLKKKKKNGKVCSPHVSWE